MTQKFNFWVNNKQCSVWRKQNFGHQHQNLIPAALLPQGLDDLQSLREKMNFRAECLSRIWNSNDIGQHNITMNLKTWNIEINNQEPKQKKLQI